MIEIAQFARIIRESKKVISVKKVNPGARRELRDHMMQSRRACCSWSTVVGNINRLLAARAHQQYMSVCLCKKANGWTSVEFVFLSCVIAMIFFCISSFFKNLFSY